MQRSSDITVFKRITLVAVLRTDSLEAGATA